MAKVVFQSRVGIRGINPYVLVEQQAAERLKKGCEGPCQ
jgi:hypothetical protein